MVTLATSAYAKGIGGSPWENAVNVLRNSFAGPIAAGLSLVAIPAKLLAGTTISRLKPG